MKNIPIFFNACPYNMQIACDLSVFEYNRTELIWSLFVVDQLRAFWIATSFCHVFGNSKCQIELNRKLGFRQGTRLLIDIAHKQSTWLPREQLVLPVPYERCIFGERSQWWVIMIGKQCHTREYESYLDGSYWMEIPLRFSKDRLWFSRGSKIDRHRLDGKKVESNLTGWDIIAS